MRSRLLLAALLCVFLATTGCRSGQKTYDRYTQAGATAEQGRDGTEAEGWYLSAVERSRALGPAEQSDALFRLGVFYRKQARFAEAAKAMQQSLDAERASGRSDAAGTTRRHGELARDLAALNRWQDAAAALRMAVPGLDRLPAGEALELRDLCTVARDRLTALGLPTDGLP